MNRIVLRTRKAYLVYQGVRLLAAIIFCLALIYLMADLWLKVTR